MSEEPTPTPELEPTLSNETQPIVDSPTPQPSAPAQNNPETKSKWRMFVAPAWFLFGILVGLIAFAGYQQFTAKPIAPVAPQTIDEATIKNAAREGLIEAIQQLQAQNSGNQSQAPKAVDKNAFVVRDANVMGNKDAQVSIVEFADFQCPYCGRHHELVEPTILNEYVKTGKANFVYKHLAFLGQESVFAAVAAECAADQGKFWEYHDYLFEHQNGENQGAFNKDKLIEFGKAINLDAARFEKCVQSDETIARVQADTQEAQKFGVSSTPTFFINGKPLVGLTSPDEFKAAIEQALSE